MVYNWVRMRASQPKMRLSDDTGARGEAIFVVRLTQPWGPRKQPWFRPHFLGEKFTTLDYLVELVDSRGGPAYFFVQVKTTNRGLTNTVPPRLRITVSPRDLKRMLAYPAPTYLIGVDESSEQAFIASVNGPVMASIPSLPTAHPLNPQNLQLLHSEVEEYWMTRDMVLVNSAFAV
jgi:hypothetical protein